MTTAAARINGTWRTWAAAVTGTLALNLALFLVIPHLMAPGEETVVLGSAPQQIQLTRLRRPDPAPPEKKPDPPKKPEQKTAEPQAIDQRRPAVNTLSLAIDITPRLPAAPRAPALPRIMNDALDSLDLTGLFTPGDLDQPLTVLSRIPPVYPFRAKAKGIQGWVSVAFTVTEQGLVEDIDILEATPETIFNNSVIQCLSAWRFKPGRIGGEPVRTRVSTRIRFELK
jgi:protein TonB